jgi:3-oxoacyl-[acyl-carrier-protein] synthase-1
MHSSQLSFSITGMGSITPAGSGINPLWENCLNSASFIKAGLGHISENNIQELWNQLLTSKWMVNKPVYFSRSLLFTLHSITNAIDLAAWTSFSETDVIIIGTTTGQISLWEKELIQLLKVESPLPVDTDKLSKQPMQSLADSIKNVLNFPGKILILSSACSASTQAIITAHNYLATNRAQRAIAGGVEELSELTINGFNCLKLLSLEPCRPFDQSRVGINLSEGAAFYTIEKNPTVTPLAYLYAGDTFLDSYHMTSPSVEGTGMQKALFSALKKNNLSPDDISMVHAHGTGSIQNDQSESQALLNVFTHKPPTISTKGVHGHALGASGAIELGICLKILNEGVIPPVTGLTNQDELIALNLPMATVKQDIRFIAKTTLGFGGVNSAFIIGKVAHA